MIVDSIDNGNIYFTETIWDDISRFLISLNEQTPDGEYPIRDSNVFARVMTYHTRTAEEAVLEAHRKYIDIQTVISGSEGIGWYPAKGLSIKRAYEEEQDVEFYLSPDDPPARVDVTPGFFVALFPHDAHMPQLQVGNHPATIKKAVVKVKTSFLHTK